jgi:hypothetical protein
VVGGYGVVGHLVAGFVAGHWPGRTLLIAGRDLGRATDAARAFADARALRLDLETPQLGIGRWPRPAL